MRWGTAQPFPTSESATSTIGEPQPTLRLASLASQPNKSFELVHRALTYLETLYPGQIGEVCFIDESGVENARVVRGDRALPADLSDESKTASSSPPSRRSSRAMRWHHQNEESLLGFAPR